MYTIYEQISMSQKGKNNFIARVSEVQMWLYTWCCNIVIPNRSRYQELRREDIFRVSGGSSKSWTLHFHKSGVRIYRCNSQLDIAFVNFLAAAVTKWMLSISEKGASVGWNCAQFVRFEFEFKAPTIYLSSCTSRVEEEQGRESRTMR